MLDAKFFRRVGPNVRDRYREHIFKKAKDVFGKPFKGYTTEYGQRKRSQSFRRQANQYANSKAPVLTSDLLRDYSLIKTMSNGFSIGFQALGDRINHLRKMGRVLTDNKQPLPKKVIKYLDSEVDKEIKKQFPKNKKVVIKIGK